MIQLFINNKPVVTAENSSVKFVRENVYFTKTGSYTMEIELPAMAPQNIAVFGHIYRKELRKNSVSFPARLMADNRELLNGTATVTNITDTTIKVQLLGGNAEFNFFTKNEDRYIDELDLGTWYNVAGIVSDDLTMKTLAETIKQEFENDINAVGIDDAFKNLARRIWAENSKEKPVDWVLLPCVNENYDTTCNGFTIQQYTATNGESRYYPVIADIENFYLSAQPYLVQMIERIFNNLGYPVVSNCLRENDFFMHLVIVTANNRSAINRALPHWTVARFLEEIENLFAVVININEVTKETSIVARADFFRDNTEYVKNILEEYSVDIEEDNATDISNANVGYAEVPSEYDRIDDELREMATIDSSFDNENFTTGMQNLINHLHSLGGSENLLKYKGTIFKIRDRSIIIEMYDHVDTNGNTYQNHARTILIDEFKNLVRNDYNDIDIELGIRPCKTGDALVNFWDDTTNTVFHLFKADNTDPAGIEDEKNIYIAGVISGETNIADTKEDTMSICLYDGGMEKRDFTGDSTQPYFRSFLTQVGHPTSRIQCFYPAGYLMSQYSANTYTGGGAIQKFANESLSLHLDTFKQTIGGTIYDYKTLYSEVYKNISHIDTRVKYCFKFICERMMPVNSTFIIRNKKFLCEKLEYKIDVNGIDKLVTGYFYELES